MEESLGEARALCGSCDAGLPMTCTCGDESDELCDFVPDDRSEPKVVHSGPIHIKSTKEIHGNIDRD